MEEGGQGGIQEGAEAVEARRDRGVWESRGGGKSAQEEDRVGDWGERGGEGEDGEEYWRGRAGRSADVGRDEGEEEGE